MLIDLPSYFINHCSFVPRVKGHASPNAQANAILVQKAMSYSPFDLEHWFNLLTRAEKYSSF
jgi:hypothetical protein